MDAVLLRRRRSASLVAPGCGASDPSLGRITTLAESVKSPVGLAEPRDSRQY